MCASGVCWCAACLALPGQLEVCVSVRKVSGQHFGWSETKAVLCVTIMVAATGLSVIWEQVQGALGEDLNATAVEKL